MTTSFTRLSVTSLASTGPGRATRARSVALAGWVSPAARRTPSTRALTRIASRSVLSLSVTRPSAAARLRSSRISVRACHRAAAACALANRSPSNSTPVSMIAILPLHLLRRQDQRPIVVSQAKLS